MKPGVAMIWMMRECLYDKHEMCVNVMEGTVEKAGEREMHVKNVTRKAENLQRRPCG